MKRATRAMRATDGCESMAMAMVVMAGPGSDAGCEGHGNRLCARIVEAGTTRRLQGAHAGDYRDSHRSKRT
eukprot:881486-Alexandrium_andersonii.AAC.1